MYGSAANQVMGLAPFSILNYLYIHVWFSTPIGIDINDLYKEDISNYGSIRTVLLEAKEEGGGVSTQNNSMRFFKKKKIIVYERDM